MIKLSSILNETFVGEIKSSNVIQLNSNFCKVLGSKSTMISNRSKTVHLIN